MVSVRLVAVVFTLLVAGHVSAAIRPAQDCLSTEPGPGVNTETSCFSINYGHRVRTFRIYAKLRASEPAPLVVVLHGDGANGSTMEWLTRHGFNRIADREGAIIVYPDGTGGIWNADDLGFLRALPRALAARFRVDPLRVYVTGFSTGGLMSFRLACAHSEIYAAAAPVAATLSRTLAARCKPSRPVSLAVINGTEDPVMPWNGGTALSTSATMNRWLRLDHCGELTPGEKVDAIAGDQTSVIPRTAKCLDETEVQLYEVQGGGHTWPGGELDPDDHAGGRVSREIDANEVIWSFLVQHHLGGNAEETKL